MNLETQEKHGSDTTKDGRKETEIPAQTAGSNFNHHKDTMGQMREQRTEKRVFLLPWTG